MRAFGVRPKRDLGQNFLIDSNILGVIAREAELVVDDVALEIGGGLGVLSEHLAQRVAHVHVVELDRALEPALRDATDPFDNVTLHFADAMKLDLRALDPAPTKVVANLPYGIAAGAILRTIEELPDVRRWVGMVQKEVGERFAAAPGTSVMPMANVTPTRTAPTAVPTRLPNPPMITTAKDSTMISMSMPSRIVVCGPARTPPMPARPAPSANRMVNNRGTLTPTIPSISGSLTAARMSRPRPVRDNSSHSPTPMTMA
ncbi:MAG: hypothetical protein KY433_10725, partial [Actinobacteria bacterium]|nr:hypothetical protein [Actinomycetota bacterium]